MSVVGHSEPLCTEAPEPALELAIEARIRELGDGFSVRRLLPSARRRMVGPFLFWDHFGPVRLPAGQGLDVRPHPHINLATVTYLFEGEIVHRDSLGSEQVIRPGAINWMTAGSGIVHSERSPKAARQSGPPLHGLQLWVGLPRAHEEDAPSFDHYEVFPSLEQPGVRLRILAGEAFGARSPVKVLSPLFYVAAELDAGAELPLPDEYDGRGAYVVSGALALDGQTHRAGSMLVFRRGVATRLLAREVSQIMLFGGAPLDGDRHIYWNFVSSSRERIERAKDDWRARRFPQVPSDDVEFIPLPE
jgi:redox-sensitive bicupin YhaK (pirin superfamily)